MNGDQDDEVLPASLESLVNAAITGDAQARERLVTEVRPFVSRYCRGRLGGIGGTATADRITDEVCRAVVDALPDSPVTGRSFRAFAYRVAARAVDEALRAPVRNLAPAERLTDRLGELLHELPPFQRETLLLRIAVGMSLEETAQAIGATPDAIRVAQHRALARLRGAVVGRENR